jgi:hypothetical protein
MAQMLLQTTSYIVPKDRRADHARILRRFRQALARLGCEHFEVYEQVGANWNTRETSGRFVQILRFRDHKHHLAVQTAERNDMALQKVIAEFCELINLPYQQQQGLFALGFYTSFMKAPSPKTGESQPALENEGVDLNAAPEPGVVQGSVVQSSAAPSNPAPASAAASTPGESGQSAQTA